MATNIVASRPPNGDRLQRRPSKGNWLQCWPFVQKIEINKILSFAYQTGKVSTDAKRKKVFSTAGDIR